MVSFVIPRRSHYQWGPQSSALSTTDSLLVSGSNAGGLLSPSPHPAFYSWLRLVSGS